MTQPDGPRVTVMMLLQIGTMNAAALAVGFGAGWLVDSQLGTTPAFIFVGMLLGIVLGIAATYREISRYLRQ